MWKRIAHLNTPEFSIRVIPWISYFIEFVRFKAASERQVFPFHVEHTSSSRKANVLAANRTRVLLFSPLRSVPTPFLFLFGESGYATRRSKIEEDAVIVDDGTTEWRQLIRLLGIAIEWVDLTRAPAASFLLKASSLYFLSSILKFFKSEEIIGIVMLEIGGRYSVRRRSFKSSL